jgi:thymidylate synthase ThyX
VKVIIPSISNPETVAMLQALYSRSHTSIEEHLKDLGLDSTEASEKEKLLQEKMKKFYIGYGHESIGDCGTTTIFIEGVSIIAAKAIQNTPLYSGQESSTRFIEFSNQAEKLKSILDHHYPDFEYLDDLIPRYYEFYQEVFKAMRLKKAEMLGVNYETVDANLKRSINAWAFDVGRGFLPSGTPTQLSFHGSLRELRKHFMDLTKHPFDEIVCIAQTVLKKLYVLYPNSFKPDDYLTNHSLGETVPFIDSYVLELTHQKIDHLIVNNGGNKDIKDTTSGLMKYHNESYIHGTIGVISRVGPNALDYGSWRDLQRHRNGYCAPTIPCICSSNQSSLITNWYFDKLPPHLQDKWLSIADELLSVFIDNNSNTDVCNVISYLLPLGSPIATVVAYNAKQWDYIFDLRLRDTVHPSLIKYLAEIMFAMKDQGIHIFYDKYIDRLNNLLENKDNVISLKRGSQTILSDGKAISD